MLVDVARKVVRHDFAVATWSGNPDLYLAMCWRRNGVVAAGRRWGVKEGTSEGRWRDKSGCQRWRADWRRSGGCPGLDFLRMGTLVVRMTGSSVLVDVAGDGGGFGVVMVFAGCSARGLWEVVRPVRLRWVGGGIGGVFGGGAAFSVVDGGGV